MTQNTEHIKLAKEASRSLPHKVYVAPNLPRRESHSPPPKATPQKRG